MSLARKNIINLIPYQTGKPIDELRRELGLKQIIKLASNENPLSGGSLCARTAIRKALTEINRYPESSCFYLRRVLCQRLRLKPDMIIFGNGSDELIDIIIKTFVEEDENIITADITFLEYQILTQIIGRRLIKVPLRDFRYDLKGILKKINKKTKVIFIANPNNPTGTYINERELKEFFKYIPGHVIVVLDEAYDIFVDVSDFPWGNNYLRYKNLIVLKTFSKAYGLAGLRIGYAISCPELISYMERVRPPFNVNSLAQIGAVAALKDKAFIKKTKNIILQGKEYLYSQLSRMGLRFVPSATNFILIDVRRDGQNVYRGMLKFGVIVRDMKQYGLDNFIRVTIGTSFENKKFISILKRVLTERG